MDSVVVVWMVTSLLLLFLVSFVFVKRKKRSNDFRGFLYLGLIFTFIGLLEKYRYGDVTFLPAGITFLAFALITKLKHKK